MYKLYHHILCPFSRKVRVLLAAKSLDFDLVVEKFWERRRDFIAMNVAGTIPVLFDNSEGYSVCGSSVIVEYIEEKHQNTKNFLGDSASQRAESRRLQHWFDERFYNQVVKRILNERYFNRYLTGISEPNSDILRKARHNLSIHLNYISYLTEHKKYLASNQITIADIAAACQISVLDYFGDINWQHYENVRNWYVLVKSHKFFNAILQDRIPSVEPPPYYSKLDF